jgi:hypothetical protein
MFELPAHCQKRIARLNAKRYKEHQAQIKKEAEEPRYEYTEKLQKHYLLPYGNGLPKKAAEEHESAAFMTEPPGQERIKKMRIKIELEDIPPSSSLDGVKSTKKEQDRWYYAMLRDKEIQRQKEISKRLKKLEEEEAHFTFQPKINSATAAIVDRVAKRDEGMVAPRSKLRTVMNNDEN